MAKAKGLKHARPTENFGRILRMVRFCSGAVGCDVTRENYHFNIRTAIVLGSIFLFFSFTTMTVVKRFDEDWKVLLRCSCMAAAGLQGLTKMTIGLMYSKKFGQTCKILERIYQDYEQRGQNYIEVLNNCCKMLSTTINVLGIIYVTVASFLIVVPFILIAFEKYFTIMQFEIPFIDIDTMYGYYLTNGIHAFCILVGGFGLFSGDLYTLVYIIQAFAFVDIFEIKAGDLSALSGQEPHDPADIAKRHIAILKHMKDMLKWHQLYLRFAADCNTLFTYNISVQIVTSFLAIVTSIFVLMTSDWPNAYVFLGLSMVNMYTYCVLGTKIEKCNEKFMDEIYDITWFNLTPSQQKFVGLMLMQAQNTKPLQIVGCYPLSVSTALQLTKTIYTISMMILEFISD